MTDEPSDADLIARLRTGDTDAYDLLWVRHIGAALRYGRRLIPGHAEDLASEAFLAIFHQVTVKGKGPDIAFRAYLFTSMRNLAMRWEKRDRRTDTDAETPGTDETDGLTVVADADAAGELLAAFRLLPARQQRALWLAEIEEVERSQIAEELGLKPNAVSQLLRRARTGLREQWLLQQIPRDLRAGTDHVAQHFPPLLLGQASTSVQSAIDAHLPRCMACTRSLAELRLSVPGLPRGTLAMAGFAALGITLRMTAPSSVASLAAGTTVALGAVGGTATTTGVVTSAGALALSGIVATALLLGPLIPLAPATTNDVVGQRRMDTLRMPPTTPNALPDTQPPSVVTPSHPPTPPVPSPGPPSPTPSPTHAAENRDPEIPDFDVRYDVHTNRWGQTFPTALAPLPAEPGSVPPPGSHPESVQEPEMLTPVTSIGYLAPRMEGHTIAETDVVVEINDRQYLASPKGNGAWRFDFRSLSPAVGEHFYRSWTVSGQRTSAAVTGSFTVLPLEVQGIDTAPLSLPLAEARESGIVFVLDGPPGASLCLNSDSGQSTTIVFPPSGTLTQRIRFLGEGFYTLAFAVCSDGYYGPAVEKSVFVDDPDVVQSPWGSEGPSPDPQGTVIRCAGGQKPPASDAQN